MKNDLTQEQVLEEFDYDYENGVLIRKKDNHGRIVNRPMYLNATIATKIMLECGFLQVN